MSVLVTPNPKKRLYDMTKEELRSECKKVGKKQGGLKDELLDRLKEPIMRNDRGWDWNHGERCERQGYLAKGKHRKVYLETYTKGPRKGQKCVWKVFKTGSVYEAKFFEQDIQGVKKAAEFIRDFNRYLCRKDYAARMIYMNMPEVWTQEGTGKKGLVEPYIAGRYRKFNSNSGWSNDDYPLMAALSHYSWYISEGKYLLCDLQGSRDERHYLLTDPVVLSTTAEFGCTDGGKKAIENFFAHHRCGRYCKRRWGRPAVARAHFKVRKGTSFFFG